MLNIGTTKKTASWNLDKILITDLVEHETFYCNPNKIIGVTKDSIDPKAIIKASNI